MVLLIACACDNKYSQNCRKNSTHINTHSILIMFVPVNHEGSQQLQLSAEY